MDGDLDLIAYCYRQQPLVRFAPASTRREWMVNTAHSFANRCLPLHAANQYGWFLLNERPVELMWNGRLGPDGIEISYPEGQPKDRGAIGVDGHFGHGIVSWVIPYVFRTPEGYNLHIRGPSNMPKDGIAPLEGVIESDWLPVPVTMNWKFTRPGVRVRFEEGEPFCMIVPQARRTLERFRPRIDNVTKDPELMMALRTYNEHRRLRNIREEAKMRLPDPPSPRWDNSYVKGRMPGWPIHEPPKAKLNLRNFEDCRTEEVQDLGLGF